MKRSMIAGLAMATLSVGAVQAAPPQLGLWLGNDMTDVTKNLGTMGYDVLVIALDDDIIEAEISDAGGDIYDVEVDPLTGLVVFVESDDDDDGDA